MSERGLAPPGAVMTVLGPAPAEAVGATLMHEHLLCDITLPGLRGVPPMPVTLANRFDALYRPEQHPGNHVLEDEALAARELVPFREAGGTHLVELTVEGIAPDPAALARIARASGVAIVAGCGSYIAPYLGEEALMRDEAAHEAQLLRAVTEGIGDTTVRAGIIGEIGCSWPLHPAEARGLRAAARVAARTGLALTVHPGRAEAALHQIIDIAEAEGLDPARLVLCHIDRTLFEIGPMLAVARRGAVLEFDFFGIETTRYWAAEVDLPNDGMRLRHIRRLIDAGHAGQVLLSHDICTKARLAAFGGHGYAHLLANVVPLMHARGFDAATVALLLAGTPRRLLARTPSPV
jgi:phosphotriesterase-related protein